MYPIDVPYVVRRHFKAGGKFYSAGSIVEDVTAVPLYKIRIGDRLLVPLPTDKVELENLCHYCEVRLGVDLREVLKARAAKGSKTAEPVKPNAAAPTTPGTQVPAQATSTAATTVAPVSPPAPASAPASEPPKTE